VDKAKVLFLCSHNTARSQIAEALLRKYAGERFEVFSAGYEPQDIDPRAKRVMGEIGLDLNSQRSKSVSEFLGKMSFAYVIIVCERTETDCPITFPGFRYRLFWPFEDPAAFAGAKDQELEKFREVRDRIDARIKLWLREVGEGD